jgi:hypothetical protein
MDYEYISRFHKNPPTIKLFRRKDVEEKYQEHLRNNPNHIKNLKEKLFQGNKNWIITPNKFPYHFNDNTDHLLIWFKKEINLKLVEFLFRGENIVYFENHENNKSIADIRHLHIFKKIKCINK